MSNHAYYESLKELAREKKAHYGVRTDRFGLREVRKIYKEERIQIDYWPLSYKIKALYMCEDDDCSVAVQRTLPEEPKLFALVHELKHHYCDRIALGNGIIHCGDHNMDDRIEKGAEVFSAEFIYPEAEFAADVALRGVTIWTPEEVVHMKRECKAKVSYRFLDKRFARLGLVASNAFEGVRFQKLEEEMYGVPFYRRRSAA